MRGGAFVQVIFQMFTQKARKVRNRKGKVKDKDVTCKYLGLYGKPGVGKSTICCEAMGHFYQLKHRGRFCRVRLDSEATGASDIAASKLRLARLMTVIKQLVGVPQRMSDIMTELEVSTESSTLMDHRCGSRQVCNILPA